jgi:hypothetical protein
MRHLLHLFDPWLVLSLQGLQHLYLLLLVVLLVQVPHLDLPQVLVLL